MGERRRSARRRWPLGGHAGGLGGYEVIAGVAGPAPIELTLRIDRFQDAERRLWTSFAVEVTERRVTLPRSGVEVRLQETGSGPPVLFVHGTMSAGSVWAPLVRLLPDFRCVLLDRPGCGLSAASTADVHDIAGLEAFGDALVVEVLDALAIECADVVATSFGGYFALRAVASRPDRFGRLVEMGFSVGAPMLHVPLLMRLGSVPALGSLAARVPVNERAVRRMLRQAGLRGAIDNGRLDQVAIDWCVSLFRDTDTMRNEVGVAPLVVRPIRGVNTDVLLGPELLASITTPVTLLWGEDDPFGGVETAEHFAAQLPNARLELLAGAGHAPWVDDPERAAGVVRTALTA